MLKDTKTRNRLSKEVENLKLQIEIFALETNKKTDRQKKIEQTNHRGICVLSMRTIIPDTSHCWRLFWWRGKEREGERVGGGREVQAFVSCKKADLFGSWGKNVAMKSDFSSYSFLIPLTSQPTWGLKVFPKSLVLFLCLSYGLFS